MTEQRACPTCGDRTPDDTIWIVGGRFYCSEQCAQIAAYKGFL